jgi:hypothetical protein
MEGKQLVSEFMGFEYINEDIFLATYDLVKDDTSHLMVDRAAEQYRTDWNWLMVVVKRVDLIILDESVNSILEEPAEWVFKSLREVNIGLTYDRVVEFIRQYNTAKINFVVSN